MPCAAAAHLPVAPRPLNPTSPLPPPPQDPAAGDDAPASAATGTFSHAFTRALLALLPRLPPAQLSTPELGRLLLCAHHPAITAGVANKRHAWAHVVRALRVVAAATATAAPELIALLAGPLGLESGAAQDQAAAQLALGAAAAAAPDAVLPAALPLLQQLLDRSAHDALTRAQVDVFETPEGMLASERAPEGVYVPEVVASKNVRKARGRMRVRRRGGRRCAAVF